MDYSDVLRNAGTLLEKMRRTAPLVHCLTNHVVTNFTANALMAAGGAPAMIHDPEEAGIFAGVANALLVNLGTLEREQAQAMRAAVQAAVAAGRPWVLDPVAVGALPFRTDFAREMLALKPSLVRGNASEILALSGGKKGGRGVDSVDSVLDAEAAARALAEQTGGAVLVTGAVDLVTMTGRPEIVLCCNGTPLLTRVTGVGCSQGAIAAALCACCERDWLMAGATAALLVGLAGEVAESETRRPGSFQIAFLDALDEVDAELILRSGKGAVET